VKRSYLSPSVPSSLLFLLGALQIAALLIAFERPARAYVDPGSGFVFLQVAGFMFAGAVYYMRHRLKPVLNAMRRSSPPSGGQTSSLIRGRTLERRRMCTGYW
jgi:hypothetical protein